MVVPMMQIRVVWMTVNERGAGAAGLFAAIALAFAAYAGLTSLAVLLIKAVA
jgi:hypothetical protein